MQCLVIMQSLCLLKILILFIIRLPNVPLITVFYLGTQVFCGIEPLVFQASQSGPALHHYHCSHDRFSPGEPTLVILEHVSLLCSAWTWKTKDNLRIPAITNKLLFLLNYICPAYLGSLYSNQSTIIAHACDVPQVHFDMRKPGFTQFPRNSLQKSWKWAHTGPY